jgi:hypothetical protein
MPAELPPGTTCRVPYADISEASGGFIFYPGGEMYGDPRSVVAMPGNTPGQVGVNGGLTYVPKTRTWLPVPAEWVTPSGSSYVYGDYMRSGKIRVVTIADGSAQDVTAEGGWYFVGTTDGGVYLGKSGGPNAPNPGAWFVSFGSSLAPVQVADHGSWMRYFNGSLWTVTQDGNLARYDVATRSEVNWATGLGSRAWIVGFDLSGAPIVNRQGALAIYRADRSSTAIWSMPNGRGSGGRAIADSMGVWFEVGGGLAGTPGNGIYLWTPAAGAKLIVASDVHVAGGCGP